MNRTLALPGLAPTGAPCKTPAVIRRRGTEATVFGLDVRSELPLSLLKGARAGPTGRTLELRQSPLRGWPGGERNVCLQRRSDGSAYFRIDEHAHAGYLIWGEGRGSYLLSADAQRLCCAPDACPPEVWQRFLIGQVLPFAALVAGLEILHASAVVLDDRAVAFAGPSGAGKTSLALELCRSGAGFLTDDVLAVEPLEGTLIAQPGTPLVGIDHNEARRVNGAGASLARRVIATSARERMARIAGVMSAFPLTALFFLDRQGTGAGGATFEPCAEARALLGSTFNFVLDTPRRMRGLLDVCALLARGRVERIVIPSSVDAGELAAAVMSRLDRSA